MARIVFDDLLRFKLEETHTVRVRCELVSAQFRDMFKIHFQTFDYTNGESKDDWLTLDDYEAYAIIRAIKEARNDYSCYGNPTDFLKEAELNTEEGYVEPDELD